MRKQRSTPGPYLRAVELDDSRIENFNRYPFHLPVVRGLGRLEFHPRVTYLIGENGTGKSTLLEAVAVAYGLNAEGGSRNFRFETRRSHSALEQCLRLERTFRSPATSYFLRAESYFNVATEMELLDKEGADSPPIINSYSSSPPIPLS